MADVVVIGAGVVGASVARSLARQGASVVLLERFEVGHSRGSSHGNSRAFGCSYPYERLVRMAQESLTLWKHLEADTGESLVIQTGGIDAGEGVAANKRAMEASGLSCQLVDAVDVRKSVPFLHPPEDVPLLFSPDAGVIAADKAWDTLVRSAIALGCELREGITVEAIEPGAPVRLRTDQGPLEADVVVVTAGPWSRRLLDTADLRLAVNETRETVAYFKTAEDELLTYAERRDTTFRALTAPGKGLRVEEHLAGPQADPDEAGEPDRQNVKRLMEFVHKRFPHAAHAPYAVETCFCTSAPHGDFVLERHGNVVIGSACTGHGFRFAPFVGEQLAWLASNGASPEKKPTNEERPEAMTA